MSWWNPAHWPVHVAQLVAGRTSEAVSDLGTAIREDPRIVAVPVAVALSAISLGYGAREYGARLGREFSIKQLIDEVM